MSTTTVNISFQNSLLAEIDAEARRESRSRSELLWEAARTYIRRQRQWDSVFALGSEAAARELKHRSEERQARRKHHASGQNPAPARQIFSSFSPYLK